MERNTSTPEARVTAFISHWYEQWSTAQKHMRDSVDFSYWKTQILPVDDLHFKQGHSSNSSNSFGSHPKHDPEHEKITECDIQGDVAQVYTENYESATKSSNYHVYDLEITEDGNWLILNIFTLFRNPKGSVIDPEKHDEIIQLSTPAAVFIEGQENLKLNENILFLKDRPVNLEHFKDDIVMLSEIGKLQLSSGVIGILDFAYDIYQFEPLHKKVSPGEYSVQAVTIQGTVAGIRVLFTENKIPIKWYAANTPSNNGVYGVDAGNLAIFDVSNLLNLSRIKKERLFAEWSLYGQPQLLSMTSENDCVITPSGFGDGAYPVFWGVDEEENLVSLYIDFMVLVQETDEGSYISNWLRLLKMKEIVQNS